jgi:hypothetical protein
VKAKFWVTIAVGIILTACETGVAAENKTFYSSGQIVEGEQWNVVKIYGDSTIVEMLGGLVDVLQSFDGSTTNMTGGEIQTLVTSDYSTASISSGSIYYCSINDYSIINFSGDAIILSGINASDNSKLNLHGGYISNGLLIRNNSMLNFYGGSVPVVSVTDFGVVDLRGGVIENWLGAWESGAINIFGYDLVKTSSGGAYSNGEVYGFWDDGTPFTIDLYGTETYLHINLVEAVDVEVKIHPKTINLSSAGRWLTCEIFIPEDCNVADVNSNSIVLEDQIAADWIWFNEGQNVLMVKFNRSALQEIIQPGLVELAVTGELTDGTQFEGIDTIKVIDKPHGRLAR